MLGGTLRRLGFGIASEQNEFLVQLVQMDEPFAGFFQFIAERVTAKLGEEETAKLAGHLLQKQYELLPNLEGVFHPKSFNYHLTQAILERVSFSTTQHASQVYEILEKMATNKTSESPRNRKLSTQEKISEIYNSAPNQADMQFEQKLKGLFRVVPPAVITLLLPLYHSNLEKNAKSGKIQFSNFFYARFFQAPMLDFDTKDEKTLQRKMLLLVNAQLANPFFNLIEALETHNSRFYAEPVNVKAVADVKELVDTFAPLFRFKEKIHTFSNIFTKFYDCIKREEQTEQIAIYRKAAETPIEYARSLVESTIDTPEKIPQMLTIGEELFQNVLKTLTEESLTSLDPLIDLDKRLTPVRERINEVAQILSQAAALFNVDSPASIAYSNGAAELRALFEEMSKTMLEKVVSWSDAVKEETLLHYETKVTAISRPLMSELVDEQTVLHRMLAYQPTDKQQYQKELECLLREGADPEATTTKYEKKGGSLKGFFGNLLSGKPPITALKLAELHGNSAILAAAIKNVEDARTQQDNAKTEKLDAFLSQSIENSRRNSEASARSEEEVPPPPVLPSIPNAEMVRIDKRNRSPGTTPRGSEDAHTDKKKKVEATFATEIPINTVINNRPIRPRIGKRGSDT